MSIRFHALSSPQFSLCRQLRVGASVLGCLVSFGAGAAEHEIDVAPGSVLLASADGVSVFDRAGAMSFGKFVTSLKDGKPGPVEWSDMIYDGCRLPSGNYLCSSHHFVRELAPDGKTGWENRVQVFEITREKKVVWRLGVDAFAGKKLERRC